MSDKAVRHVGIVLAIAMSAGALAGCSMLNHKVHRDCLVTSKDERQQVSGSDGNTYTSYQKLVTTSCGVFEVGDTIAGGWQSYDRWAVITTGHRYDITTGGFRYWGSFPSVIDVQAVSS
ncbi:hypothetical protein A5671_07530 [Mycolicibacter heraklionensis]|nr:hypothetical protein A5671_07530 [Mycolicibacter heraklionensis]